MTDLISTEQSNPASHNIDLMNGAEIASVINLDDQKVALAVGAEVKTIGQAIELIAASFNQGGRMGYFGAGTSGRIGILDASECPPTYGVDPELVQAFIAGGAKAICHSIENAEDKPAFALADLNTFAPCAKDIVVAISASGNPQYVVTILKAAQQRGCKTIAVTTNRLAAFKTYADIFICPEVGPEVITGSSRMKSGTAQKLVLNMLTTGAMIRLGKTFHNYMVDVRVTNEKLQGRAIRIIGEITGATPESAQKYLAQAANNVKVAIIMADQNCTAEQAQNLLAQNSGIIRRIIKEK